MRRLPIYLLLDCSESMAGEAIRQLQHGIAAMVDHLQNDPQAIETAYLSVITFAGEARQVVPLTELLQFTPPELRVRTGSALGAGLRVLAEAMRREVRRTTATQKGDFKPLVIVFSDGQPTDDWEPVAEHLKGSSPSIANVYAIGCGPDADLGMLRELTDIVLRMTDLTPETWRKVFVWLTASVQATSRALERGGEGQPINLPGLPADALELAPPQPGPYVVRQVFLHARCQHEGRPYLMRFARRGRTDVFVALGSHPLDVVEKAAAGGATVSTAQLEGVPPCPHCENPTAVGCSCGTLVCLDPRRVHYRCPTCGVRGEAGPGGGGFDVRQASG